MQRERIRGEDTQGVPKAMDIWHTIGVFATTSEGVLPSFLRIFLCLYPTLTKIENLPIFAETKKKYFRFFAETKNKTV